MWRVELHRNNRHRMGAGMQASDIGRILSGIVKTGFQFICPMYGLRCSRKGWHHQHDASKRFVFLPCLCLAVMVPWLESGPHRIYAFAFILWLPPYCAEFGELRLTFFNACCHQGRAWARAAPYLTQPVLSTETIKTSLFVFSG